MGASEVNWYAVTTRSRHEKVVAEQLWQKEIECFLPLHEVVSKWKDRFKKVQFPLFPGLPVHPCPDSKAAPGYPEGSLGSTHNRVQR